MDFDRFFTWLRQFHANTQINFFINSLRNFYFQCNTASNNHLKDEEIGL